MKIFPKKSLHRTLVKIALFTKVYPITKITTGSVSFDMKKINKKSF